MATVIDRVSQTGREVAGSPAGGDRRRRRRLSGWHFVLLPVAVLFLVPFLQMALASFSPAKELLAFPPPFIPSHFTVDGYVKLFAETDILLWLRNTVIVAATAIVSNIVLCSLAGYGFARLKFAGRNVGFIVILATIMIPTQLLMIPTYILFAKLGLLNGLGAAIVPWLATAFGIFLMRQFFLSLPSELEEAGAIDGCNRWQIFFRIVLPLATPAIASFAIFQFIWVWNDLLVALIFSGGTQDVAPLTQRLAEMVGSRGQEWERLTAGAFISIIIPLAVFFGLQRYFVRGLLAGSTKG